MIGMIACSILITISLSISNPENNDVVPDCNKNETDCNNEDSEVATDGNGIFAIISTLAFVMFFAFGPGSIPWLITGELFTQGIITYMTGAKFFREIEFHEFFSLVYRSRGDKKNCEIIQFHEKKFANT